MKRLHGGPVATIQDDGCRVVRSNDDNLDETTAYEWGVKKAMML